MANLRVVQDRPVALRQALQRPRAPAVLQVEVEVLQAVRLGVVLLEERQVVLLEALRVVLLEALRVVQPEEPQVVRRRVALLPERQLEPQALLLQRQARLGPLLQVLGWQAWSLRLW